MLPIARDSGGTGATRLPVVYDQDEDSGALTSVKIHRDYAKLWQHCVDYANASIEAVGKAMANGETMTRFQILNPDEVIQDAFQANYHVSLRELTIMEVIESGTLGKVMDAILDVKGAVELKKSEDQDTGSTSDGVEQLLTAET